MWLVDLHEPGEPVVVLWPGGPDNFKILFSHAEAAPLAGERWRDWITITGFVVEPSGLEYRTTRSFFVHPVEGVYALLPKKG